MDENKHSINEEEASELQKASEAELQAELDGGDTDIFEPKQEDPDKSGPTE